MDDLMSIILFAVLFRVLNPVIQAIFRGFGGSDHGRDR